MPLNQLVLPGEKMIVTVVKDGKEHNQGVAYLDDGTNDCCRKRSAVHWRNH